MPRHSTVPNARAGSRTAALPADRQSSSHQPANQEAVCVEPMSPTCSGGGSPVEGCDASPPVPREVRKAVQPNNLHSRRAQSLAHSTRAQRARRHSPTGAPLEVCDKTYGNGEASQPRRPATTTTQHTRRATAVPTESARTRLPGTTSKAESSAIHPERETLAKRPGARSTRVKASPFKGVTRAGQRWRCKIFYNGRSVNVGHFNADRMAAMAYDIAAWELGVANRRSLNFSLEVLKEQAPASLFAHVKKVAARVVGECATRAIPARITPVATRGATGARADLGHVARHQHTDSACESAVEPSAQGAASGDPDGLAMLSRACFGPQAPRRLLLLPPDAGASRSKRRRSWDVSDHRTSGSETSLVSPASRPRLMLNVQVPVMRCGALHPQFTPQRVTSLVHAQNQPRLGHPPITSAQINATLRVPDAVSMNHMIASSTSPGCGVYAPSIGICGAPSVPFMSQQLLLAPGLFGANRVRLGVPNLFRQAVLPPAAVLPLMFSVPAGFRTSMGREGLG